MDQEEACIVEESHDGDREGEVKVPSSNSSAIADHGSHKGHTLPRWYPKWRGKPILYGYPEALAWLLSNTGHSVYLIGGGAFVVPAMLHLATQAAGCDTEPLEGQEYTAECHNTIYGMKPSSLITTLASVISFVVAILIPLVGAVIDYTPHRRLVGRILSGLYCVFIIPQIFISEDSWFFVLVGFLILGFIMWTQTLIVHAYLPELTEDQNELNELTKAFSVIPFASIVMFIFVVLGIATAFGVRDDDVITGRIAASVAFVLLAILYSLSWGKLFDQRPAANTLKEGQSLWTAGFTQIYATSKKIYHNYSALTWFYVAVAFGDPKPLTAIAITFFTNQLQFTPLENGLAAIVLLLASIPGAVLSSWFTRRFNPIWSSMVSMIIMLVATATAGIVLKGPGQQIECFIIVAGWGMGGGWRHTSTRMLASSIIPEGQDAELMGFYLFADQLLSWLPPIIFTALNEAGCSQRIGICTIDFFFFVGFIAYFLMGDYGTAVKAAGRVVVEEEESVKSLSGVPDETFVDATTEDVDVSSPSKESISSSYV